MAPARSASEGHGCPSLALRAGAQSGASFLFWAVVFGLVYTQAPLYYSNQNQYFLHGLAQGGYRFLSSDWLANTADPTPWFSFVIAVTYRSGLEVLFYAYYILLFGVYFQGMLGIFKAVATDASPRTRNCFIAALLVIHSAALRYLSWTLLDGDYPWFLQAGVANQYILGPTFQPSAFGAFVILSVALFLGHRPFLAVFCSSGAAFIHSTYLLGAALLTVAYLFVLLREQRRREALGVGLLALTVVAPTVAYNFAVFRPTSAEVFDRAQELLVHVRVPHHAEPRYWFDGIAAAQVVWIVGAWWLVRRSRLGTILAVVALVTLVLTLVQVFTSSDALALLFPWRTTAFLVPIATAVILARVVAAVTRNAEQWPRWASNALWLGNTAAIVLVVGAGVALVRSGEAYASAAEGLPVLEHVRSHPSAGDTYLLPVSFPPPPVKARSPIPSDFKSPALHDTSGRPLHFDLQRFRLYTGAPIFIDFKSIPYQDVEVLEWYERVQWAHGFYQRLEQGQPDNLRDELAARGITHVVVRQGVAPGHHELEKTFAGDGYEVYRVKEPKPAQP